MSLQLSQTMACCHEALEVSETHSNLKHWRLIFCREWRQYLINTIPDRQSHHNWGLEVCFEMSLRATT